MKKVFSVILVFAAFIVFNACKKNNPVNSSNANVYLDLPSQTADYFNINQISSVGQNEKATIGRVLFYDNNLSINNGVSCASCHKQQLAFADNSSFSRGFENKLTGRNSPSIENLPGIDQKFGGGFGGDMGALFWDGRVDNAKNLVRRPITNHVEMGIEDEEGLVAKLNSKSYYHDLFKNTYGDENVTMERVSECIGYFITSIKANNTRFDQYRRGDAEFSASEMQGMALFNNKYKCNRCHNLDSGVNGYISLEFLNIGLDPSPVDKGRGAISGNAQDMGTFKVPNLRNVALTAPYMHDGRFRTLDDVLNHYSKGINDNPTLSEALRDNSRKPIRMNISDEERRCLVAFLNTLTDTRMLVDTKFSSPFRTR